MILDIVQTGFLGCFGSKVDAIDYYKSEIEKIGKEVSFIHIFLSFVVTIDQIISTETYVFAVYFCVFLHISIDFVYQLACLLSN